MSENNRRKEDHHAMQIAQYHAADMNDRLIINLRDLSHIMRFLYEGRASQKRILMILQEAETITQRDLTERLGIQPGSASEILFKLESAGLIVRTRNEDDRRTTDICLTENGRALAKEALMQRKKRHEEMFSCLSEEEKQELLSLLERLCTDWRTRYSDSGNAHERGHHEQGRGRQKHHEQVHHDHGHHGGPRRHGGN